MFNQWEDNSCLSKWINSQWDKEDTWDNIRVDNTEDTINHIKPNLIKSTIKNIKHRYVDTLRHMDPAH